MDDNLNNEINTLEREAIAEDLAIEAELSEIGTENVPPVPVNEPDQEIIAVLDQVVSMSCAVLAPAWNIQPEETLIVSQAFERVLEKYMPNAKDSFGCEMALVLAVGAMVLPRLSIPRHPVTDEIEPQEKLEPQQAIKTAQPNHIPMSGDTIDLGGE